MESGSDKVDSKSDDSGSDEVDSGSDNSGSDIVKSESDNSGSDEVKSESDDSGSDEVKSESDNSGSDEVKSESGDSGSDKVDFGSDDSLHDPDFSMESSNSEDISQNDLDNEASTSHLSATQQLNGEYAAKKGYLTKNERQKKRNSGEMYTTTRGKRIAKRNCVPLEMCRKKCRDKITYVEQKQIFDEYWKFADYNKRILYISSLIQIEEKLTQTLKKSERLARNRQNSNYYFLEFNGDRINVCQGCFLKCFGETKSFIRSVIKKKNSFPNNPMNDLRGKKSPKNKLSEQDISDIESHILSFPAYESHYCRNDSAAKYLSSDLSISKMHKLFCEQYKVVSVTKYTEIFRGMNLKFKKPKLDGCNKCDTFKIKLTYCDPKSSDYNNLKHEQKRHHEDAELAYQSKRHDIEMAKSKKNLKTYTFDLQKNLPTPFLRTSTWYYKRKLSTFNLTIHDCESNQPFCYMWHEGAGSKGGNEISSCLFKHLNSNVINESIDSLIFYSDSSTGQNKNSLVSSMFIYYLQSHPQIKTIDHKFLVPGHTHMECDVDHAVIERKKKRSCVEIHHPRDWYQFVQTVGTKKQFLVIEMKSADFFDFKSLAKTKLLFRNLNANGQPLIWNNVKWLRYTSNDFGKIMYKNSLLETEPFEVLNVMKTGMRSLTPSDVKILATKKLISNGKKSDLLSILHLINPCFHDFYKSLNNGDTPSDDPDMMMESSDLEQDF